MTLRGLVSIHDVMPETRTRVEALLHALTALPAEAVTLLVVPGRGWRDADLDWLRGLAARGYPLAGHGWRHRCGRPRTLHHRLHSAWLSRDAAEHLSLDSAGIEALVADCYRWFVHHGLNPAPLYVPPAWALGALPRARLASLPFRYVETLTGIHDTRGGRFTVLPLVGFEADSRGRAVGLRLLNRLNLSAALLTGRPLRLALHPDDPALRLGAEIPAWIARLDRAIRFQAALSP